MDCKQEANKMTPPATSMWKKKTIYEWKRALEEKGDHIIVMTML
jgi:hypothetical protein